MIRRKRALEDSEGGISSDDHTPDKKQAKSALPHLIEKLENPEFSIRLNDIEMHESRSQSKNFSDNENDRSNLSPTKMKSSARRLGDEPKMKRDPSSPRLQRIQTKKSIDCLRLTKSPSKTSHGRIIRDKQEGGGKLQGINRPKMLKKLSERYEKGEVVIVDLIKALMHEICPLYEVQIAHSYSQGPSQDIIRPTLTEQIVFPTKEQF